jgi:hypothetical protein
MENKLTKKGEKVNVSLLSTEGFFAKENDRLSGCCLIKQ